MKKLIIKKDDLINTQQYHQVLLDVKVQIDQSQAQAFQAINEKLNQRNWLIGKIITEKQAEYSWGSSFIDKLVEDIQKLYPGIEGFSRANIFRMKAFYQAYKSRAAARQIEESSILAIPWHHNVVILEKVKNYEERLWYANQVMEHGLSRSVLEQQIKKNLFARDGKAISNFTKTLAVAHGALAQQSLKDPYIFDFLTLHKKHVEQELEQGLINNVQKLLLELGKGFAFVGRQYHVRVGDQDFYIDLLFFHIKLKAYVVVELKARDFEPRDAGQLNFYLSAVDNQVKQADHNPTIGLLLCRSKNNFVADYALQGINRPIGVSEYVTHITKAMEEEIIKTLPSIKEIEAELDNAMMIDDIITQKK